MSGYPVWYQENARRRGERSEPKLTEEEFRADQLRKSDGLIHPWWSCTDPAIRAGWLRRLRHAMSEPADQPREQEAT